LKQNSLQLLALMRDPATRKLSKHLAKSELSADPDTSSKDLDRVDSLSSTNSDKDYKNK